MFDYAEMAALGTELLTEFGQTVTHHNKSIPAYNPADSSAAPTNADTSCKGALFDYGKGQTVAAGGGLIQQGDKRLLVEAGKMVPSLEDQFTVNGSRYVVKCIGDVNPAGVPVLYDLQLRK